LFLYVALHLLLFAQVYVGWSGALLIEELKERPYVLVGFSAWLAMLPLALTSTDRARRWLGRRWKQLHRLIYPATVLAWLHLFWLARSDVGEALVYGVVFAALLLWRFRRAQLRPRWRRKNGVVGWRPKLLENTGFTALRPAWAVVKIAAPRSSFDPVSAPAPGPKTFFKKGLHGFKRYV
jgi:hypothetical protein